MYRVRSNPIGLVEPFRGDLPNYTKEDAMISRRSCKSLGNGDWGSVRLTLSHGALCPRASARLLQLR